jgi:N-acetylglucosaminyldiphosphoundecaprenol N-acetyl-beta-D-mannosaminyltransferase
MAQNQRRILGINFFTGDARAAVERMESGGLLVVPAAPALKDLATKPAYREALLQADLCISDSAMMVMLWNLLEHDSIRRTSGLAYLRELLARPSLREPGATYWIMANPESSRRNLDWLREQGIEVPADHVYIAPFYKGDVPIEDPELLAQLQAVQPGNIIVTVGGGTQERLGLYIKQNIHYPAAIHCIGAAIAFLSGDQVRIPVWADKLYLGWLLRCVSEPSRYIPRYWAARKLFGLMLRYRSQLPALEART